MTEPTKEQIKVFWEWCGLNEQPSGSWYTDSGEYVYMQIMPIDLNNLFQYAVPKVIEKSMSQGVSELLAYQTLFALWLQKGYDALALFWAIYAVLPNED